MRDSLKLKVMTSFAAPKWNLILGNCLPQKESSMSYVFRGSIEDYKS